MKSALLDLGDGRFSDRAFRLGGLRRRRDLAIGDPSLHPIFHFTPDKQLATANHRHGRRKAILPDCSIDRTSTEAGLVEHHVHVDKVRLSADPKQPEFAADQHPLIGLIAAHPSTFAVIGFGSR
jgi:hypothetical protein